MRPTGTSVSEESDVENLVVAKDLTTTLTDIDFTWCM